MRVEEVEAGIVALFALYHARTGGRNFAMLGQMHRGALADWIREQPAFSHLAPYAAAAGPAPTIREYFEEGEL